MNVDILALVRDVAFPIVVAGYLLLEVTRKLDSIRTNLVEVKIYLALLLAEKGISLGDPLLATYIQQYLESKKQEQKKGE